MTGSTQSVCSVSTLPDDSVPGRGVTTADTPRPYVVEIPSGGYIRRNHSALSTHAENTITCTVWLTQQTALLAAGQPVPEPKQAYLFDLLTV